MSQLVAAELDSTFLATWRTNMASSMRGGYSELAALAALAAAIAAADESPIIGEERVLEIEETIREEGYPFSFFSHFVCAGGT